MGNIIPDISTREKLSLRTRNLEFTRAKPEFKLDFGYPNPIFRG